MILKKLVQLLQKKPAAIDCNNSRHSKITTKSSLAIAAPSCSTAPSNVSLDEELFNACLHSDVERVKMLLELGANAKAKFSDIVTVMVKGRHNAIVSQDNPNAKKGKRKLVIFTPSLLHVTDNICILNMLLEHGANVNEQSRVRYEKSRTFSHDLSAANPLLVAILLKKTRLANFFICKGANVKAHCNYVYKALELSSDSDDSSSESDEISLYSNCANFKNMNSLHLAAMKNCTEIVECILLYGHPDIHLKTLDVAGGFASFSLYSSSVTTSLIASTSPSSSSNTSVPLSSIFDKPLSSNASTKALSRFQERKALQLCNFETDIALMLLEQEDYLLRTGFSHTDAKYSVNYTDVTIVFADTPASSSP